MSKPPKVTQDEPTQPRKVDANGRQLDEHGLPLSGPARVRALGGRQDPREVEAAPAETTTAQEG